MRCENCGKVLPEDSPFCSECGVRTRPHSAGEMAQLARSTGLISTESGAGPAIPEPAEAATDVPPIPEPAPLPGERRGDGGQRTQILAAGDREEFVAAAHLREEKRRAAQALLEAADREIEEELGFPEQSDTMIWQQQTPEAGGHVGMGTAPPPPPPPPLPPAEERIWAEVGERSEVHGVGPFGGTALDPLQMSVRRLIRGAQVDGEVDAQSSSRGCGCIALAIFLFLMAVIRVIINIMD